MATAFHVSVLSQEDVHTLPGAWENSDLRKVLELADADDIGEVSDNELEEFCLMSLQDLGNQKAGEIVLETIFGDRMRPGVRQNLVDDLQEDQPWDDFPEISQQRGIFVAVCLLQKAFPTRYGTPDATRLTVRVRAETPEGLASIDPGNAAWLIRVLACGMSESSLVHRLYGGELKSGRFTEAEGLVWDVVGAGPAEEDELSRTIAITSSSQLLSPLVAGRQFKAVV